MEGKSTKIIESSQSYFDGSAESYWEFIKEVSSIENEVPISYSSNSIKNNSNGLTSSEVSISKIDAKIDLNQYISDSTEIFAHELDEIRASKDFTGTSNQIEYLRSILSIGFESNK